MTAPKYKPYSVDAYNTLDVRRIVALGPSSKSHLAETINARVLLFDQPDDFLHGVWKDTGYEYGDVLVIANKNAVHYVPGTKTHICQFKSVPFKGRIC